MFALWSARRKLVAWCLYCGLPSGENAACVGRPLKKNAGEREQIRRVKTNLIKHVFNVCVGLCPSGARPDGRPELEAFVLGESIAMFESAYASQVSIACFVSLVLVATVSDVVAYRIPNVVIVMLLVLYPIFVVVTPGEVEWMYSLGIFAAVIGVGLVLYAFKVFGAGDVKLLAAVLLWAGPALALPALVIAAVVSGVLSLLMLSSARFVIASALSSISKRSLGEKFLARSMPWGTGLGVSGIFVGWGLMVGQ